ncbi:CheR family methyltransferase [Kaarinaea lacus]
MNSTSITSDEYQAFRGFLEQACGIVLGDNKQYLVTSRLTGIMAEFDITSFSKLMEKLLKDKMLKQRIMDAMTTNETSWFRDEYPYDILKEKILPEAATRKVNNFKLWSAACSSGQEPYSISMIVSEYLSSKPGSLPNGSVQIVGTDISSSILQKARSGQYEGMSVVRGLSAERKQRFFKENGQCWEIRDEVKKRVSFREMNLMQNYALLGKFDVIFCRNVLIYFSPDLKKDIIKRMASALNPNGYLILGGSESISGYSEDFNLVRWKNGVVYTLKT